LKRAPKRQRLLAENTKQPQNPEKKEETRGKRMSRKWKTLSSEYLMENTRQEAPEDIPPLSSKQMRKS
jgi:hypothetical protein